MRRHLARTLAVVVTVLATNAVWAVDMTGQWATCGDCRINGVCDPMSQSPTDFDQWDVTQTGTALQVDSQQFSQFFGIYMGTIDPATGAFSIPRPPNVIAFEGVATFSTLTGTYDSSLQQGSLVGARLCNPLSPACDDGDPCTDDACVSSTIGTCTNAPAVDVCTNTQSGSCVTTTSTSTSSTTTTSMIPPSHHPVTGAKLVIKKSANGRESLTFVTRDPTIFVPAVGSAADPTTNEVTIEVHSPVGHSYYDIDVPPGVGNPGWTINPTGPLYKFKNSFAPAGISVVRQVKLQGGKGMKIVARETGLDMTQVLGGAGIAIVVPQVGGVPQIICAHFGAASIRKDVPPVFIARTSPAPVNCYQSTLSQP
jgi:hypothetical protein